jgi:glycosyltransferase involved in cell wall biosynthesis
VERKPKLLWVGDICASTGFARVTDAVVTRLTDKYEVVVLGCNMHGDPHPYPFPVYPATNRFQQAPFGEERIREVVLKENPDIVFTVNDIWIVCDQYNRIKDLHKQGKFKFIAYVPVDGYDWFNLFEPANDFDELIIYTHYGAVEAVKAGYKRTPKVVPHGVDTKLFYPINLDEARKSIGIPRDRFIVFNGNRNQPRKRMDITIKAFAEFAVGRPDTLLYLHMGTKDMGYSVMPTFLKEMKKRGLEAGGRLILTSGDSPAMPSVPVDQLNIIYNTADVGINSCVAEGWGLVSVEQAACGVPQIVPDHTSCKEIFEGYGDLIPIEHVESDKDFGRDMHVPSATELARLLQKHYENVEYREMRGRLCYERATQPEYQWNNIAERFAEIIQEVLEVQQEAPQEGPSGFVPRRSINLSKKKGKGKKNKKQEEEIILV